MWEEAADVSACNWCQPLAGDSWPCRRGSSSKDTRLAPLNEVQPGRLQQARRRPRRLQKLAHRARAVGHGVPAPALLLAALGEARLGPKGGQEGGQLVVLCSVQNASEGGQAVAAGLAAGEAPRAVEGQGL